MHPALSGGGWLCCEAYGLCCFSYKVRLANDSLTGCWARWLRNCGTVGNFNRLGSLSNLFCSCANVDLAFRAGFPGFSPFLEDDIMGTLSLDLSFTLAVDPAGSIMAVVVQGSLPGSEAVSGGGGEAAGKI